MPWLRIAVKNVDTESERIHVTSHWWLQDTNHQLILVDMIVMIVHSRVLFVEIDENVHQHVYFTQSGAT